MGPPATLRAASRAWASSCTASRRRGSRSLFRRSFSSHDCVKIFLPCSGGHEGAVAAGQRGEREPQPVPAKPKGQHLARWRRRAAPGRAGSALSSGPARWQPRPSPPAPPQPWLLHRLPEPPPGRHRLWNRVPVACGTVAAAAPTATRHVPPARPRPLAAPSSPHLHAADSLRSDSGACCGSHGQHSEHSPALLPAPRLRQPQPAQGRARRTPQKRDRCGEDTRTRTHNTAALARELPACPSAGRSPSLPGHPPSETPLHRSGHGSAGS